MSSKQTPSILSPEKHLQLKILASSHSFNIQSWIKHLGGREVLLWTVSGFYRVKLNCISEQILEQVKCGSLVEIKGQFKSPSELCVEEFKILHSPLVESEICKGSLPEDPVEYTLHYYRYVKHPVVMRSILIYSLLTRHLREYLYKEGFIELPPPIVGYASDPGLRGARKAIVDLYGRSYELQSSLIMYKQLYASVYERIFYVARNIRIEPPENTYTGRHLAEFTQVDVEVANVTRNSIMSLGENAVYYAIKKILRNYSYLLEPREIERIEGEIPKPPYPRITYDDAVEYLAKLGVRVKHGEELPFEAEALIATNEGTPVWITGFPTRARGFYNIEDPEKPGYNIDYNLLLPSGLGEVLDGGCREYRYEYVVKKIREIHNEPLEKYKWFLELVQRGEIRPTCGWGVGVERLVKYVLGLKHIAYATPHPRLPGVLGP